jgi:hypothetical protein
MIVQSIVKLGKWLETRFPEKLVVKAEEYLNLKHDLLLAKDELSALRHEVATSLHEVSLMAQRVAAIESTAVHKGAVQDLVAIVKAVKDELQTLKTNIGFANPELARIEAHFNGEPVQEEKV